MAWEGINYELVNSKANSSTHLGTILTAKTHQARDKPAITLQTWLEGEPLDTLWYDFDGQDVPGM